MSTQTAVATRDQADVTSYVPFGAQDSIKLSVHIVQTLVAVPTKSGQRPSQADALKFIMLCKAQRLNPFAGDAYLVGYDKRNNGQIVGAQFSLITAHLALMKRAEASDQFEGMESGIILTTDDGKIEEREGDFFLPGETVVGGWCKVYRKGRRPTYKRLALDQRKPKYDSDFWQGNKAAEQIVKCAEADALRSTFPTLLGGLYAEGEMDARASRFVSDVVSEKASLDASRLVETAPAQIPSNARSAGEVLNNEEDMSRAADAASAEGTDLGPQTQKQKPANPQPSGQTAVQEFEAFVTAEGFTFNHVQRWAMDEGTIENADSMASFSEIPENTAKRLLRARTGLINGLKKAKEVLKA